MFTDQGEIYQIQGPMGKGLDIHSQGVHIAFTAGTGCLVFMDLVGHFIRKALGMLSQKEETMIVESTSNLCSMCPSQLKK